MNPFTILHPPHAKVNDSVGNDVRAKKNFAPDYYTDGSYGMVLHMRQAYDTI